MKGQGENGLGCAEPQEQPSEWKNQARGSTSVTTPPRGSLTLEGSLRGVLGQEIPGALVARTIPDSPVRNLYHNTY